MFSSRIADLLVTANAHRAEKTQSSLASATFTPGAVVTLTALSKWFGSYIALSSLPIPRFSRLHFNPTTPLLVQLSASTYTDITNSSATGRLPRVVFRHLSSPFEHRCFNSERNFLSHLTMSQYYENQWAGTGPAQANWDHQTPPPARSGKISDRAPAASLKPGRTAAS